MVDEVQLSAQGSIIKTAYEAEVNAFTDTKNTKLAGIVPGVATTNVFEIPGSLARGDLFFIDASGNLVRLPAGDTGKFLKTQGTTGDPMWEALPGGGDMLQATYDPNADGIFAIAQGGTGQSTAQAAIDALSQVAGATNEHVLTKDTGTGNATWKVGGSGGGEANTASNVGTAGTELFKQKSGLDLEFKNLKAGSSNIVVDEDVPNNEVHVDVGANVFLADGSVVMGGHIDMGDHQIRGVDEIRAYDTGGIRFRNYGAALNFVIGSDGTHSFDAWGIGYMNGYKITGLLAGSTDTDAVRYDQVVLTPSGAVMGDVMYHNGSTWTRLPAGTDGRVLTTHGGGANPTWAEASGGGLTNPMTVDLDMGGNDLLKCFGMYADGTASQLDVHGGVGMGGGGGIACFGKTHTTVLYRGDIRFYVPDAAGNSDVPVVTINGLTDTPTVDIYYGLDMHSKTIESSGDITTGTHNTYDLGKTDNRWANVYTTNIITGDLVFEERECHICGEPLNKGETVSLIVLKTSKNGTHTVPIHSSCIGGNN